MRIRACLFVITTADAALAADWQPLPDMATPRAYHTVATFGGTAEAIVAGGCTTTNASDICADRTALAEIFDGSSKFLPMSVTMSTQRTDHTATTLKSGDVLVVGGCSSVYTSALQMGQTHAGRFPCTIAPSAADLFQAMPRTFAGAQPGLVQPRLMHTATLVVGGAKDGFVVVAGGFGPVVDDANSPYAIARSSVELYDPNTKTFAVIGNMSTPRARHTATLLSSGKILFTGGVIDSRKIASDGGLQLPQRTSSAEVFDPATGTTTVVASMAAARSEHNAVGLVDGRVLVASSSDDTMEIFDPQTEKWSAAISQVSPHDQALLLGPPVDLVVLFSGSVAFLYDPIANTVRPTGTVALPFEARSVALPGLGRALVTGGRHNAIDPPLKTAFVYTLADPGQACALDTDCRLHSCIDGVCCKSGCNVPCGSCDAPTGDCRKVVNMDHPTCAGTNGEDRRTCGPNGECKKKQGVFCDDKTMCITGFCSDGFCCESACDSACVACDFPTPGLCVGVAPQPVNGRPKCPLGQFCSGSGPDCVPAYCDGDHLLRRPRRPDVDCAPYRCAPAGTCFERCNSVDQCAAPNICDANGLCVPIEGGDAGCALGASGGTSTAAVFAVLAAMVIGRRGGRRKARG